MTRLVILAAVTLGLLGTRPAAGEGPYEFTLIAESGSDKPFWTFHQTNDTPAPSINGVGAVAFEARPNLEGDIEGIYIGYGDETVLSDYTVVVQDTPSFGGFDLDLGAFDLGDFTGSSVVFRARTVGTRGEEGLFVGDGADVRTVFLNPDPPRNFFSGAPKVPSLNRDERSTFLLDLIEEDSDVALVSAANNAISILYRAYRDSSDGPFDGFDPDGNPAINDAGDVLFVADKYTGGGSDTVRGLFRGSGGGATTIVLEQDDLGRQQFLLLGGPPVDLNNQGEAAFVALNESADGESRWWTLHKGDGGSLLTLAETTTTFPPGEPGSLHRFRALAINDPGDVVFEADRWDLGEALFRVTASDGATQRQKVIGAGDTLFGSEVRYLHFARDGLNDDGQIAFQARLLDGRLVIVRADPPCLPFAWVPPQVDGTFDGSFGDATRWNRRSLPKASSTLVFDIGDYPYAVTLDQDRTARRLEVGGDQVTLDLAGATLRLADAEHCPPIVSLAVGLEPGEAGELTLNNGTVLTDRDVEVQNAAGATGSLTIGPDASLVVAPQAEGEVRVGMHAAEANQRSVLTVRALGQASGRLEAHRLLVGPSGRVNTERELVVGDLEGVNGHALVRQRVTVRDGGQVVSALTIVGGPESTPGRIELHGQDAVLRITGNNSVLVPGLGLLNPELLVGALGSGELLVRDGARAGAILTTVGFDTGSRGTVELRGSEGATAKLEAGQLSLGVRGEAELVVLEHAVADSAFGLLALEPEGRASVRIQGTEASWINDGELVIGHQGQATMGVEAGGRVQTGSLIVGNEAGAVGTLTLRGTGRGRAIAGAIVGNGGTGRLRLESGAGFQGNFLTLGEQAGALGHAELSGSGTTLSVDDQLIVGPAGAGLLQVRDSAVAEALLLTVGSQGVVELTGGTVIAQAANVLGGGRVLGVGRFEVAQGMLYNAGTIAPGLSPGTLTIDGDFEQDAEGLLSVEVAGTGPDDYDRLIVTGEARLGGTFKVDVLAGAELTEGDEFQFLVTDRIVGAFDELLLPELPNGQPLFSLSYGPDALTLTAEADYTAAVPEPATAALLALGMAGLMPRRRMRRDW